MAFGFTFGIDLSLSPPTSDVYLQASQLDHLTAHYDASDSTTFVLEDASVTQWNDKSASGAHAAESNPSRRPTTGMRSISGLNALEFDGVDDQLHSASSIDLDLEYLSSAAIFVVLDLDAGSNDSLLGLYDENGSRAFGIVARTATDWRLTVNAGSWIGADFPDPRGSVTAGPAVLCAHVNGQTRRADLVLNGVNLGALDYSAGAQPVTGLDSISIGTDGSLTQEADAAIGEIVVAARTTERERADLTRGLMHKWGFVFSPEVAKGAFLHFDAGQLSHVTESGGAVSALRNIVSWSRSPTQAVSADQPVLSGGVISFDGVSEFLGDLPAATATQTSATTVPDNSNAELGKGFTCTGLARAPDGTWWVGDHGQKLGGQPQNAKLVHLSGDFSSILTEIDVKALIPATDSIQGVVFDESDNTLWYASHGEDKIYHIQTDGVLIGADTIDTSAYVSNPNGLAIDPNRKSLWVLPTGGTTLSEFSMASGALLRTITGLDGSGDQIWYEPDLKRIWLGRSDSPDHEVFVYDVNPALTGALRVAAYATSLANVEGLLVHHNKLYACNDDYFHGGPTGLNQIVAFDINPVYQGSIHENELLIYGVFNRPSSQSSGGAHALFSFGSPYPGPGVGAFGLQNENSVRVFIAHANGADSRDQFDFAYDSTVEHVFVLAVDYSARTLALYINGVAIGGVRNLVNVTQPAPLLDLTLGKGQTGDPQFSNLQFRTFGAARSLQDRLRIEGALAHSHGLTGLLPLGHPYKIDAPKV